MGRPERVKYWDIVKGIAIILVVYGHSFAERETILTLLIYSFHMPLFMLISGYFFYFTINKRSISYIVKNKFLKTIVPIVLTTILVYFDTYDPKLTIHEQCVAFYAILIRELWFLWAIFIDSMIVMAIHYLSNFISGLSKNQRISPSLLFYSFSAIVCVLFMLLPDISVIRDGVKFMFPCFIFGFCINQYDLTKVYKNNRVLILTICLLAYICLFTKYDYTFSFYRSGVYIFNSIFSPSKMLLINIYRVAVGILGSLSLMMLVYEMSQKMSIPSIENSLAKLGRHTLGVYILSWILNYYWLKLIPLQPHFNLYSLANTIVMLIVSYAITILFVRLQNTIKQKRSHNA